jgi:HK97 family phage major capsid protein/HK97 family phage prohead protease
VSVSRSKAFRLERVKSASPDEGKPKAYKFRANDGDWDRYQDRLSVAGWQLDAFNANPVILYNHDAGDGGWLGLARKDVLPIGRGRAYVEGDALMVDIEFDQDDEFARKVESKVEKGILNAVSVRYVMKRYHENERGGYDCDEQELLEISVVTIPGNQRAVRVKSLDDLSSEERDLFDAFASAVAKKLSPDARASQHQKDAPEMTPEQIKAMQEENARLKAAADAAEAAKAAEAKKAADEALAQKAADIAVAKIMDSAKGNRDQGAPLLAKADDATPDVKVGKRAVEGSGLELVRFMKAEAVSKMRGISTVDVLKAWGYTDMAKALSQGSYSGLGSLVMPQFASDFIELLRNEAVVRRAGARVVPMGASLVFGGQTSAATAAYGGETEEIAKSEPATGAPLVLSEKKLRGLVLVPNDLIRNASIGTEEFIRNDLVQVMALTEDSNFLSGDGTQSKPLGLKSRLKSTHIFAMTALTTAGVPLLAEVKKQIGKVKKRLRLSNAPMRDMAWFMSPSTEQAIHDAMGPGGEGDNMYSREMNERGTLAGWKYFVTNQIVESGTADLFAFDMAEVIIGESMSLEAEVFPNGTITSGGTVISGVSTDQTVLRAISKHDIGLRHQESGINVTGVTWGQ